MIPKENIEEIIDLFNQNLWIVYIPFILFFGCSIFQIGQMKNKIEEIQFIVDKHVNDQFDPLISVFEEYSFVVRKRYEFESLSADLKESISSLRWKGIEKAENWIKEVEEVIAFNNGLFHGAKLGFGDNRSKIKLENKLIKTGEHYPGLRRFISLILAENILNVFAIELMPSGCCFCGYFSPVVQKFGDVFYVYPDKVHENGMVIEEIKINGEIINDKSFTFRPTNRGMNILDIEYKFFGYNGLHTLNFKKELMVK